MVYCDVLGVFSIRGVGGDLVLGGGDYKSEALGPF